MNAEQLAEASRRFLEKYPAIAQRIDAASVAEARRHDVAEEEVRSVYLQKAIEQQARTYNLEPYRYLVRIGIDTPDERERLLDEYDGAAARELGMSLAQYREPVAAGEDGGTVRTRDEEAE
ncbi:DUF6388 family protein [Robbsia sp. Bb-Pol-6]|uniref:DUF6388 family protein n=1 Tax=Robbsia betulipollinis TaxID=2981849 RepID=A0ABT3ZH62_9BURK|nr:DUF6388 family protein [Robbsia betulipollinis]MCY0385697.1 DUF6388 family protein [Robbsia betulipollinis]